MDTIDELIRWARDEANKRARYEVNGMTEGCDRSISKLRQIADWLEILQVDKACLDFQYRHDLDVVCEPGDPEVGVFPHYYAGQEDYRKGIFRLMGQGDTPREALKMAIEKEKVKTQPVEPQRPKVPSFEK